MPGMMDCHIHTAMFNCMTFHNHRVAQWEVTPQLQQMYSLFHAQNCFDMGFTTLRDLGMNSSRGLFTQELCAVRDSINAGILEVRKRLGRDLQFIRINGTIMGAVIGLLLYLFGLAIG
ncbi:hypothetical protein EBR44_12440 [bacterium]|nr:hypothetical protein [bacterium]